MAILNTQVVLSPQRAANDMTAVKAEELLSTTVDSMMRMMT
jgi:hypothetical protein